MLELESITDGVFSVRSAVKLMPGVPFPVRSTVLRSGSGSTIVSPIAFDSAGAAAIDAVGTVERIVAPNRLHHLHVASAAARWPRAKVFAAPGLPQKRPDLRFDAVLEDGSAMLGPDLDIVVIEGAPGLSECVLFHRSTRTLVLTDLAFCIGHPPAWSTGLILRLVGVGNRFGQSRALRWLTKDRAAAAASVERVLALPFERIVLAHDDVIDERPHERLAEALGWMLAGKRAALGSPPLASMRRR